ncbi:MAG: hypothetical protein ACI9TP_001920, partial [Candidatus Azotimanducaceae bacterium]
MVAIIAQCTKINEISVAKVSLLRHSWFLSHSPAGVTTMANQKYSRPHRSLMFAEGPRAFAEMAGLIPSAPFLLSSPRGDQHHVLVMPGLGASDLSTTVLRSYLAHLGYRAHSWNLGRNLGPAMPNLAGQLSDRL